MTKKCVWAFVALLGLGLSVVTADEPAVVAPAEAGDVAAAVVTKTHKGLLPETVAKPVDWFEWGADIRVRQVYFNNIIDVSDAGDDKNHFFRIRERFWGKFQPDEDVEIGFRIVGEWRCYFEPDRDTRFTEYFFDQLYFQWKNIGDGPVSFKIGRDELAFGKRWLIFEGTPLDGSRSIFFDFVKFGIDLDGDAKKKVTNLDLVFFLQEGNHAKHLPVINDRNAAVIEHDSTGAIAYFTHVFDEAFGLDLYWFYYDLDTSTGSSYAHGDNIHTVGARAFGKFGELAYSLDVAGQLGTRTPDATNALGILGELVYTVDPDRKGEVHFQFEYLSGDDPASATHECFVPHFGRYPQWSDLYIYSAMRETAIAELTNLIRLQFGTSAELTKQTKAKFNYNLLFANQNAAAAMGRPGFSAGGNLRGHLFQARLDHTFNEWLSGHVTVEYFVPGGYYSSPKDNAIFARWELMVKF